jgi:hypothetical protein
MSSREMSTTPKYTHTAGVTSISYPGVAVRSRLRVLDATRHDDEHGQTGADRAGLDFAIHVDCS